MRLASFVISFCLHASFVLLVLFWPSPPLHKPAPQAIAVSLVEGLPGGNIAPAPILGPQSPPAQSQTPPPPAAPPKESPPPVAVEPPPVAVPVPVQEAPSPRLEVPKPVPVPEPDAVLLADKKTEEPPKPETHKEEAKKPEPKPPPPPRAEPPKPAPPKPAPPKPAPPKRNPAEEALAKLRAEASSTQGARPNAVADALQAARQESSVGGSPGVVAGGGSIADIYGAQIVMAVQPNWHWPALAQGDLSVTLYLKIDAVGRVLDVRVNSSSGNALFDSSAVAAVRRTQVLPTPPSPAFHEIVLPFFPMR